MHAGVAPAIVPDPRHGEYGDDAPQTIGATIAVDELVISEDQLPRADRLAPVIALDGRRQAHAGNVLEDVVLYNGVAALDEEPLRAVADDVVAGEPHLRHERGVGEVMGDLQLLGQGLGEGDAPLGSAKCLDGCDLARSVLDQRARIDELNRIAHVWRPEPIVLDLHIDRLRINELGHLKVVPVYVRDVIAGGLEV